MLPAYRAMVHYLVIIICNFILNQLGFRRFAFDLKVACSVHADSDFSCAKLVQAHLAL